MTRALTRPAPRPLAAAALALGLVLGGAGVAGSAAPGVAAVPATAADQAADQAARPGTARAAAPTGVPQGAPAAARRAEPRLTTPRGWPFAQRLPRTFGTERLHGGASYWSDFVHDDHGAAIPSGLTLDNTSMLAPEQGVYEYADGPARGNGADVFVAATGVDARASYWRVDWNTLVDPDVPLAVWTFDTDSDVSTGVEEWPADAGVTSAGMDKALVVSSRGAWVEDLRTGRTVDVTARGGRLTVDRATRSFVVRVPRQVLPVGGAWRVRLAAGVASRGGRTMAPPRTAQGLPTAGLPRVYNLGFRSARQEKPVVTDTQTAGLVAAVQRLAATVPPFSTIGADGQARFVTGNFWMEDAQADALASGDVSAFSHFVRWGDLARDRATAEPLPRGYTNRWYVSALDLGQGRVANAGGDPAGDGRPNYLGRIQPYSVYVPRSYDRREPAPLTWTLHSLGVNHNQYSALDPRLLQQLCEERGSICAGTLGYGPDGWYFDEAENDYWSVWRSLADAYTLDSTRTVISGYSMGGWATYKLGLSHPDLYAAAVTLAGPPQCGVSLDGDQLVNPAFGERCTTDGTAFDLVGNARHLPYLIGQGTADQLVPFTSVERQVARFDGLGLRHRFVRYPGEDHLLFALQDRFDTVVEGLGTTRAVRDPREVDLTWQPHLSRRDLGIGVTGAYWTSGLTSRRSGPGTLARVRATSYAVAGRAAEAVRTGPTPVALPLPALRSELALRTGEALPRRQTLRLDLDNVRRVVVDADRARLRCGARLRVVTDGPVRVVVAGLPGGPVSSTGGDRSVRLRC